MGRPPSLNHRGVCILYIPRSRYCCCCCGSLAEGGSASSATTTACHCHIFKKTDRFTKTGSGQTEGKQINILCLNSVLSNFILSNFLCLDKWPAGITIDLPQCQTCRDEDKGGISVSRTRGRKSANVSSTLWPCSGERDISRSSWLTSSWIASCSK
jgi:hypothetical protein